MISNYNDNPADPYIVDLRGPSTTHPHAKRDVENYLAIHRQPSSFLQIFKKISHIIGWGFRLLMPSFLVGHPNLFDNLYYLWKNPQFRPMRMLGVFWLILVIVVSTTGIYSFFYSSNKAKADSPEFSIQTGSYLGNGTSNSITGLGFRPEVVIIKSDSAAGQLVWKSNAMPANVSSYLGVATGDNTENEITLNDDGFTVSAALEVNTTNITFTFIAFAGSNCTSGGSMCVGAYTGDGTANQTITTGFTPDLVWVKRTTALVGIFRTSSMSTNSAAFFSATANNTTGTYFTTLNPTSFTVGLTNNTNGGVHYYVAFKSLANKLKVSQFTGNGVDDRNITGVGYEPDFVLIKQDSAIVPAFNTTEMYGDNSSFTIAAASAVNNIQSLDADGFQVGNSTSVNANGIVSNYFAFGGSSDPTPSGSFFMYSSSYTGTGAAQSISTPFRPNLIIIKGNTNQYAMWGESLSGDSTEYFGVASPAITGAIVAETDSGFNLGTSATVNSNGNLYEYTAFGNATSPRRGDGADDFYIGTFTGNGIDGRTIDHLGFTPSMVVIKRTNGTANQSFWKAGSPVMADNTSAYFSATADITSGSTIIKTLNNGGFTVGNNAGSNAVGATYTWFAFKEGPNFHIGSYTGNAVVDREITGVGFSPDLVWTKRDNATEAVFKSNSGTINAGESQHFLNLANDINDIKTLTSGGFTLGNSAEVNANAGNYRYAAWNSSLSGHAPDTPTNTSPTSGATDQNLNATISGSTYSDLDSNSQTNAQWQVDDDSDFSSPVWTRTSGAGETSTSITSANGTFANELSGKTVLDHDSAYYWRVRYSDGVWSNWSTTTVFNTNKIETPLNSSPSDTSTVTSLTPTLSASTFTDNQSGDTASSSEWQISTSNNFDSPLYDSGPISFTDTYAIPSAVLSNTSTYYWRVRYQDSNGLWSIYSNPTRFFVSESEITVKPLFGNSIVDQNDPVKIDAQIKLSNGDVIDDASVSISIYDPAGTKIVDGSTMAYLTGSGGIYRFSYTIPAASGSYLYEVSASSNGKTGIGAANFEVRTFGADLQTINNNVNTTNSNLANASTSISNQINNASSSLGSEIQSVNTTLGGKIDSALNNLDVLIGAFIISQSSVNDSTPSSSLFYTNLSNATDNFYKNSVLTFTSGDLKGQSRRISAYTGSTRTVRLDPALTSAPLNGDTFTVVAQNVRVEEQVADIASTTSDTNTKVSDIQNKVNSIYSLLQTVDSNIGNLQNSIDTLRTSQQSQYNVNFTSPKSVQTGGTYRGKIEITDFESHAVDADSSPTITIYNSDRTQIVTSATLTKTNTGIYEYTYSIPSSSVSGIWESVVNIPISNSNLSKTNYWEVTGSPAQVLINSMQNLTVPDISANVTITNEGNASYEYPYQWCVVTSESGLCSDSNVVAVASAAKLIQAGESFTPVLSLNVPQPGNYWFKLKVTFGTQISSASRNFTAVSSTGDSGGNSGSGNSGGSSGSSNNASLNSIRSQLELNAVQMNKMLSIIGNVDPTSPGFQSLLSINEQNTGSIKDIQNKVYDLKAISATLHQISDNKSVDPIVQTYMKFNSVELHFLITNPDDKTQVVHFKAFLPEEIKPENILNSEGLKVDYDATAKSYFVSGDISINAGQSITKKVEMKDIWLFPVDGLNSLSDQAHTLANSLIKTQYYAQASLLESDIKAKIFDITSSQTSSYDSPQNHIVVYRQNLQKINEIQDNINKLKDFLVQSGASAGLIGSIGHIQTFAVWGIILAILFGFGLMAALVYVLWRNQMIMTSLAMGIKKEDIHSAFMKGQTHSLA